MSAKTKTPRRTALPSIPVYLDKPDRDALDRVATWRAAETGEAKNLTATVRWLIRRAAAALPAPQ